MSKIEELKQALVDAKKEYRTNWLQDPACNLAYSNLAAHIQSVSAGMTPKELGEYYGTKDRGTILKLLRFTPNTKAAPEPKPVPAKAPSRTVEPWTDETVTVTHNEDGSVTVTVTEPFAVDWLSPRPVLNKPVSATWYEGIKVKGDQCLQAELKAGNPFLDSLVSTF